MSQQFQSESQSQTKSKPQEKRQALEAALGECRFEKLDDVIDKFMLENIQVEHFTKLTDIQLREMKLTWGDIMELRKVYPNAQPQALQQVYEPKINQEMIHKMEIIQEKLKKNQEEMKKNQEEMKKKVKKK